LPTHLAANVLLRVGSLSGYVGQAEEIVGMQVSARNLIAESRILFAAIGYEQGEIEADIEYAKCLRRENKLLIARGMLAKCLKRLEGRPDELTAKSVIMLGGVEYALHNYNEIVNLYKEFALTFELIADHNYKGRYHGTLAAAHDALIALSDKAADKEMHVDAACMEYEAASYHYEQAGDEANRASIENNFGNLFLNVGDFPKAIEHLECAHNILSSLSNPGYQTQVEESLAQVYLAQQDYLKAERFALSSVKALEGGGELWALPEALLTLGVAQARQQRVAEARAQFRRAYRVADQAGNGEVMAKAARVMDKEIGERMADEEMPRPPLTYDNNVIPFRVPHMIPDARIVLVPDNSLIGVDVRKGDVIELDVKSTFQNCDIVLVSTPDGELLAVAHHEPDGIRLEWSYGLLPPRKYKNGEFTVLASVTP
jgi:tetratricopeptide (TPR) repeat protein